MSTSATNHIKASKRQGRSENLVVTNVLSHLKLSLSKIRIKLNH